MPCPPRLRADGVPHRRLPMNLSVGLTWNGRGRRLLGFQVPSLLSSLSEQAVLNEKYPEHRGSASNARISGSTATSSTWLFASSFDISRPVAKNGVKRNKTATRHCSVTLRRRSRGRFICTRFQRSNAERSRERRSFWLDPNCGSRATTKLVSD